MASGAGTASAASITGVGAEITTVDSAPSGSTWTTTKDYFRSTDTTPKAYVLPGNVNAYGQDGYSFYGMADLSNNPIGSGTLTSLPGYVSSVSLSGSSAGVTQYTSVGGVGYIDDPRAAAGPKSGVPSLIYGQVITAGPAGASTFDVLSFQLSATSTFRVGVMTGGGDFRKPLSFTLTSGAASATLLTSGQNTYLKPDWYFFDVTGDEGDILTLSLTQDPFNSISGFSGVVFDSVATVPEPSSLALIGFGIGACVLVVRSRRKLS